MFDWIGWVATAIFATSYLSRRPATLRGIQAVAALAWISYGILIHAVPVIGANVVVALAASYSAWREYARATPRPEVEVTILESEEPI